MEIILLHKSDSFALAEISGDTISSSDSKKSGRTAYLFDNFVVKFGYGNERELKVWDLIEEEDKKHFANIYGHGTFNDELYIIQERVFPQEELNITEEHIATFIRLEAKYGLYDLIFCKRINGSTGIHNVYIDIYGNLKIYDFECSDLLRYGRNPFSGRLSEK